MLFADKLALENRTKVRLLAIRERELHLYVNNCRAVGTAAAVFSGLMYLSLLYTKRDYFQNATDVAKLFYCLGLTTTMCMALEVSMATTAVMMLGPGLALRGPDGSMHNAVDGLLIEFEMISRMFNGSIFLFILTAISYSWLAASVSVLSSLVLTLLCMLVVFVMIQRTQVVETNFPIKRIPLISGAFFARPPAPSADSGVGDIVPALRRVLTPAPAQPRPQSQRHEAVSAGLLPSQPTTTPAACEPVETPLLMADRVPSLPPKHDRQSARRGKQQML